MPPQHCDSLISRQRKFQMGVRRSFIANTGIRTLQIPQGKFWMELDYGAYDSVDGVISQALKIIETYDLEVLGRQSVVLEVQNSSGRSVRFEDFVEVVSDADRDAISDAEELAVGTDPDDQSSCFDCYVFQNGFAQG